MQNGKVLVSFSDNEVSFPQHDLTISKNQFESISMLYAKKDLHGSNITYLRKGETMQIRFVYNNEIQDFYPFDYTDMRLKKHFESYLNIKINNITMGKLPIVYPPAYKNP